MLSKSIIYHFSLHSCFPWSLSHINMVEVVTVETNQLLQSERTKLGEIYFYSLFVNTWHVSMNISFAFLTCSDMSSIWLLDLKSQNLNCPQSLLHSSSISSGVLVSEEFLVRKWEGIVYFFTTWMTSSCSMMCVRPTRCGLYFVLVPWKHKRDFF